jgi:UPF0755 protein
MKFQRKRLNKKRGHRKMYQKILLICIIFISILYTYQSSIFKKYIEHNIKLEKHVMLEIKKGMDTNTIANKLFEKNIIISPWAFKKYLKKYDLDTSLQAGSFLFSENITIPQVIEILQVGKGKEFPVTLLPGITLEDFGNALEYRKKLAQQDFIDCLKTCDFSHFTFLNSHDTTNQFEGYLFPDTYFFEEKSWNAKILISRLLRSFEKNIIEKYKNEISTSSLSIQKLVILASLIEKESRGDQEEKQYISGIIYKRLSQNIPLGIDATTRYETNNWSKPLYTKDFKRENPYNTRLYKGLPPTAISTFHQASFYAALHPKKSPYLYYLHDKNGQIHYAKTLKGHNQNKQKYLR